MDRIMKKVIGIILSLMIAFTYFPSAEAWAVDDVPEANNTEAAGVTAASADNEDIATQDIAAEDVIKTDLDTENINEEDSTDDAAEAQTIEDDGQGIQETPSEATETEEESIDIVIPGARPKAAKGTEAGTTAVDPEIENGTVTLEEGLGTAVPDEGYDLATVRQISTDAAGNPVEQYLEYTEENGVYTFAVPEAEGNATITAFFYDLNVWDGAVDLTWYDPEETDFEISTPAQLAGVAAIANGMVDENVTAEYMIKDNEGREVSQDGGFIHRYLSTEAWTADLLAPTSGTGATQVRGTVWRLPEVEHMKVGGASDDIHNDFLYRTVRITADLDMSGANWTPIGGKYSMDLTAKNGADAKVIDTRFHGKLDGQGHTVILNCNRFSSLGFAYAMDIALVGYLGGGVDYDNGYAKDTSVDYENYWVPTVKNVTVKGSVEGRRMVGGIVGRIGETNHGVLVENCSNYADIKSSDMRGCAGIVGAAWGQSVIRNCYNVGTIRSGFWEHGGIVGSNGYEGSGNRLPSGADIYNCYNAGTTGLMNGDALTYDGQEIGVDGGGFASYKVSNCYYEAPETAIEGQTGYSIGPTTKNKRARLYNVEAADLRSQETIDKLNANGKVFFSDDNNINNGYPVLYYQTEEYKSSPENFGTANVTITNTDTSKGSISAEGSLTDLPYGSCIQLTATAKSGYRFGHYLVTEEGSSESTEVSNGDFVVVTGRNITIEGVFGDRAPSVITFAEEEDDELYYVIVTKVYDGYTKTACEEVLSSGSELNYEDMISLKPVMKPLDGKFPNTKSLEYSGELSDPDITEYALNKVQGKNDTYSVTGEVADIELKYRAKTQGKRWTTIADTSWYKEGTSAYTLTTARQLAGVAKLCAEGTDFKGVTINLGSDISLANTAENGGDIFGRSWIGIGASVMRPFRGIFNGQGHTVRYMYRNFGVGNCEVDNGGVGGLFGVTDGAIIRNVRVEAGAYVNDDGVSMDCGFINGAEGGAIVGSANNTTIENCFADVPMSGGIHGMTGGIAGEIEGSTVIRNCTSNCAISGAGEGVGGIVAILGDCEGARIENCTNNGAVSSTKWKVGGILGSGEANAATIFRCVNKGTISSNMRGTSSNVHAIGGIAGYSSGMTTISQCVNYGDVNGNAQSYSVGGIAGTIIRGTITECANLGNIYSECTMSKAQVAGIANVGTNKYMNAAVKNSYNAGTIRIGEKFASSLVGGVAGAGSSASNSFSGAYCTQSSVALIGNTAGIAGTVVADSTLKSGAYTLLGNNFARDTRNINKGYPVLAWQDPTAVGIAELTAVTKRSDTALTSAWKTAGPISGIELYRSVNPDSGFSKVYSGAAANYNDSKLAYGKTYYYKVRAYRSEGGKVSYSAFSAAKSYSLIPAATKFKSVKNIKGKKVKLKWKKVSGVTGYEIYRSTKKNKGFKKIKTIKKGKTVTFTDKKLKKGKTYYYKIRTYKTVSKKKGYSAYSAVKKVKIKK